MRPLQQFLQRAIFIEQEHRRLHTNPRHAGNIIDAVPCQRLYINDAIRFDAKFLFDLFDADIFVLHRVAHDDIFGDQLHQVLIRAYNRAARARFIGNPRIGRDEVIRLKAFHLNRGRTKGNGRFAGQRKLRDEVFGRLAAIGFILVKDFITECMAGGVKDNGEMRRAVVILLVLQKLEQHVRKPGHRANRQTVRFARQRRQSMIGPENIGGPIDQNDVGVLIYRG